MVGNVLALYVTVLVLAVCVCVVLAIVQSEIRDDRCDHPTYLRILLSLCFFYPLTFSKCLSHLPLALRKLYSLSDPALVKERKASQRVYLCKMGDRVEKILHRVVYAYTGYYDDDCLQEPVPTDTCQTGRVSFL